MRKTVVRDHIKPRDGETVLDIGCGPATMLPYLGQVTYTGIDLNPAYIETAKTQFGDRGTFVSLSVDDMAGRTDGRFESQCLPSRFCII